MSAGNDEGRAAPLRKRRSWSTEEKCRIVDESLENGASTADVARRDDLNANQLFTWRRQFGVEPLGPKELAPILPVTIAADVTTVEGEPSSIRAATARVFLRRRRQSMSSRAAGPVRACWR